MEPKEQLLNNDFQEYVGKSNSAREIWRRYYNLPRTDPRYLSATDIDILEDLVSILANKHSEEWNDPSNPVFNEFRKKIIIDPEHEKRWKEQAEKALNEQSVNLLKEYK